MYVRTAAALAVAWALVLALGAGHALAASDPQLLRTYQPVTYFEASERFGPASVQSFIADSSLERLVGGAWATVDPDPEPGELPGPGTGVWRLNQRDCSPSLPLGGLACYAESASKGAGGSVVYGHVAHLANATVLQYWYFYYDDVYSYLNPPSDFIWQAHEGDWEVVNVVLGRDEEPVEAGYSQHCLGERRAWATTPRWEDTHPVVYVAAGSHANYFSAGTHPIDVACVPPQAIALLLQNRLPLPVDFTGDADVAGPPQAGGRVTTIHNADGGEPWLSFPGFWGELQYFHAPVVGTIASGTSPVGPAYHAAWQDPLGTLALWPAS